MADVTVPIPLDTSSPAPSSSSIPSAKKMSIMIPIVTSGMMIGRYNRASKTRCPRNRNRSRLNAASVPSTTEITVELNATCKETQIESVNSASFQNASYQPNVNPPQRPTRRSSLNEKITNTMIGR